MNFFVRVHGVKISNFRLKTSFTNPFPSIVFLFPFGVTSWILDLDWTYWAQSFLFSSFVLVTCSTVSL